LQFQCSGNRWLLQEVTLHGMTQILPLGESEKELGNLKPSCQGAFVAGASASN
jgi:hypothetical protein